MNFEQLCTCEFSVVKISEKVHDLCRIHETPFVSTTKQANLFVLSKILNHNIHMGKHGYNHGDFGWNEFATKDPQAAVDFYTAAFGWKVEEMDMPNGKYHVLLNGEEKVGGIMVKPPEQAEAPNAWMPYITVDSVDETAAKIETLGGKIIMPPEDMPVPNGPRLSIVQDPSGATLGIITYASSTE